MAVQGALFSSTRAMRSLSDWNVGAARMARNAFDLVRRVSLRCEGQHLSFDQTLIHLRGLSVWIFDETQVVFDDVPLSGSPGPNERLEGRVEYAKSEVGHLRRELPADADVVAKVDAPITTAVIIV